MPHIVFDKGHHQIFHLSQSISAKDFCIGQTISQMQVCFHLWPQVTAQYLVFTARHGGQRALEPDSIHLVVQQENRLTKAEIGRAHV